MFNWLINKFKKIVISIGERNPYLRVLVVTSSEKIFLFFFFSIFSIAFCYFQLSTAYFHHMDTAFLMETIESIRETGVPTTSLLFEVAKTFTMHAEEICNAPLIPSENIKGVNVLENHAYFILYPLAIFALVFSPHAILAVANGLSFISIIFIIYWVLRRHGVSFYGSSLFCALVLAHPAWSYASLGDFYSDRFFMPLGLLYVVLVHNISLINFKVSKKYLFLVLLIGSIASSTTERGAIMIAIFTATYIILDYKKIRFSGATFTLGIFSLILFLYVYLYLRFFHVNDPHIGDFSSFFMSVINFFENIKSQQYSNNVVEFLVINIIFFGIFAIFNWRFAIIGFGVLLPNLLGNIGGAEKTGWATHYHSMYFPFLIFAAAIGFCKLWNLLRSMKYQVVLSGVVLLLIISISNYSRDYGSSIGALKKTFYFYTQGKQAVEKKSFEKLKMISDIIPSGSKVVTLEPFMPILHQSRTIYYYPIGIDVADYAVLTKINRENGSAYYSGAVSYIGESEKINACLNDRLKMKGYDLDNPKLLIDNIAVLERKKD